MPAKLPILTRKLLYSLAKTDIHTPNLINQFDSLLNFY
jgi:hypothetical protein